MPAVKSFTGGADVLLSQAGPERVSSGVVCLMLIMLGVALFAGFDLMGTRGITRT